MPKNLSWEMCFGGEYRKEMSEMMYLAKKIRLIPSPEHERQLWMSAGVSRWAYNWTLARQEANYSNGNKKFLSDNVLRKEITQLKKIEEYRWLGGVSSKVASQSVIDACNAYKRFFKGISNKPKFKSKRKTKPSFYCPNDKIKFKNKSALIEKVGWIKTAEKFPIVDQYFNPRVTHDGKYWYLSVIVEKEIKTSEKTNVIIGIDLGIKELAVCSNGMAFKNINKTPEVRKIEKRLKRLQRKVSKKYLLNKEGERYVKTSNIIKLERNIRLLYRRLKNIRDNHLHQATNAVVKTKPSKVVMEDLDIKGMMKNKYMSKAVQNQKMYEFKRQMIYKCRRNQIEFLQVDRWFPSSKTCSNCGNIKRSLNLQERMYVCECGIVIDRDMNAALNLAKAGI